MKTKIKTITTGMIITGMMLFAGLAWAETSETTQTVDSAVTGESSSAGTMGLVKMLTSQLDVTEKQATGGAGSLFNMAKGLLPETDYGKVAEAIPGISELIKAAPDISKASSRASDKISGLTQGLGSITSAVENAGKYAAVYEQFKKLGLKTDMVSRFIPVILSFVESTGGEAVINILKSVWE